MLFFRRKSTEDKLMKSKKIVIGITIGIRLGISFGISGSRIFAKKDDDK